MEQLLTIGDLAQRSGVAASALRYYETLGLLRATRTAGNQRRYRRTELRRLAFVRIAQRVGLSLEEIAEALAELPGDRVPTKADWARISARWRARLETRIRLAHDLRDRLKDCIGCGCLSLQRCRVVNPADELAGQGSGPRLLDDSL